MPSNQQPIPAGVADLCRKDLNLLTDIERNRISRQCDCCQKATNKKHLFGCNQSARNQIAWDKQRAKNRGKTAANHAINQGSKKEDEAEKKEPGMHFKGFDLPQFQLLGQKTIQGGRVGDAPPPKQLQIQAQAVPASRPSQARGSTVTIHSLGEVGEKPPT